jgi:hypothetical protein
LLDKEALKSSVIYDQVLIAEKDVCDVHERDHYYRSKQLNHESHCGFPSILISPASLTMHHISHAETSQKQYIIRSTCYSSMRPRPPAGGGGVVILPFGRTKQFLGDLMEPWPLVLFIPAC